jgi:hypothetical protein
MGFMLLFPVGKNITKFPRFCGKQNAEILEITGQ